VDLYDSRVEFIDALVVGGGQSGLAAARALRRLGLEPVIAEAGDEPTGSWPSYYDSLTLFSPARYSELPGLPFGGDPDRYPHRDEVISYLLRYAAQLDADIRTGTRVESVTAEGRYFTARMADGQALRARAVVSATGGYARPYRPPLPGLEAFAGVVVHTGDYRTPEPFAGQRVIVVGAGNSAVQIAAELAEHATVTLATRAPVKFIPQHPLGRDLHFWLKVTGFDILPAGRWIATPPTVPVFDDGRYQAAIVAGRPRRQPVFTGIDGNTVSWPDGTREEADVILLATGYLPDLDYLAPLGALDESGRPRHAGGISTTHPGLGYVGLAWQRSVSSASIRGSGRDAAHTVRRMRAHLRSR
jgi:putative flavoprotein involved in K+ transport